MVEVLQFVITSSSQAAASPALSLHCTQHAVAVDEPPSSRKRRRFSVNSLGSTGRHGETTCKASVSPLLAAVLAVPPAVDSDAATAVRTAAVRTAMAAVPVPAATDGHGKTHAKPPTSPQSQNAFRTAASFAVFDSVPLHGTPLHAAALAAAAYPRSCAQVLELLASSLDPSTVNAALSTPALPGSALEGATALHLLMLLGAEHAPHLHHAVRTLIQAGADRCAALKH